MLSYCKQKYSNMMSLFYAHYDPTVSLYVDKPVSYTLYTLRMIMDEFSDSKIVDPKKKVILAINFGTLSDFIESDTHNQFAMLKS